MTNTLRIEPKATEPLSDELKLGRRASRRYGLFEPQLLKAALPQAFVMLRPDIQWKNPVMFVVEIGAILTILFTVGKALGMESATSFGYLLALDFWLILTLLFANFASALAEARGKAQAESLRKTRRETPAQRLRTYRKGAQDWGVEQTSSSNLQSGDIIGINSFRGRSD